MYFVAKISKDELEGGNLLSKSHVYSYAAFTGGHSSTRNGAVFG